MGAQDEVETGANILTQIFSLSDYALNVVSTVVMFAFAIYSLCTTCGLGGSKEQAHIDADG